MALPLGTRLSQCFGDLAEGRCPCSENDWEVRSQELHQVQVSSEALYSHNLPHHWATAAHALGHMRSPGNSHRGRSMYAALHWQRHEAYGCVHIELHVGSPWKSQRMEGSQRKGAGQASEAISYRWRRSVHLQEICRISKIRGHTQGNDYALHSSV